MNKDCEHKKYSFYIKYDKLYYFCMDCHKCALISLPDLIMCFQMNDDLMISLNFTDLDWNNCNHKFDKVLIGQDEETKICRWCGNYD